MLTEDFVGPPQTYMHMKSARITAFTQNISDIHIADVPIMEPAAGQVRVRMLLSPVNPSDLNFVHGTYSEALQRIIWNQGATQETTGSVEEDGTIFYDPAHKTTCPQPPYSLGGEGVGIVDAVGSGFLAKRLQGKRVAIAGGPPNGTWQEYTVVDAKKAVVMPDAIPDEQAAMFFVNPLAAFVITREVLRVPRGGWLIVTAAGSALGKSVVRLSKVYGFKTICVVRSDSNTEELRQLGADAVIETNHQDLVAEVFKITEGKGAGFAMDCVGGDLSAQLVCCLGLNGRLVLYGTLDSSPMKLPIRDLMMPVAHIEGFLLPNWMLQQSPLKLLSIIRQVKRLTIQGIFAAEVTQRYSLDQVVEAVTAAVQPGRTGKVMLQIGEQ
ncbi:MAG: zinc-dependent alcohol dehydrogenase family protein [Proteobacteria bacterium]|nr:zinc-dependent alcohol dehydrogenase family protein [Pseudomonadota bacterium]